MDNVLALNDENFIREKILETEAVLLKAPQIDVPIEHYFSKGVYAREMKLNKGELIVGKIHKFQNLNILSKGEVSVVSVDGMVRIKAPHTFVASPGAKRVIYAHEDSIWTVIHGTEETDVEKIEDQFTANSYEELYLTGSRSFSEALLAIGTTPEQTKEVSENEDDLMPFRTPQVVYIDESKIHGKGLFTGIDLKDGEHIAPARRDGMRTPAGRYANHSGTPNAKAVTNKFGDVDFIALAPISAGTEITTDYYFNFTNTRGLKCLG